MKFTWNIQKVNFYTDQVEEKGQIDLSGAIQQFQSFPWEEQLKEVRNREETSTIPTITFVGNNGQKLGIWTTDINLFELYYENDKKSAHLTISNDFNINSKGLSIEDFIELFFNEQFENNVVLEKNSISKRIKKETQYKCDIQKNKNIKYLLFPFVWFILNVVLVSVLYTNNVFQEDKGYTIFIQIILLFSWAPGFYLYITYNRKNKNATLRINTKDKIAIYKDSNQEIKFSRNDVKFCLLSVTKSSNSSWSEFQHIRIDLKNGKSIWITFLLADTEKIIKDLGLHHKKVEYFIPTL